MSRELGPRSAVQLPLITLPPFGPQSELKCPMILQSLSFSGYFAIAKPSGPTSMATVKDANQCFFLVRGAGETGCSKGRREGETEEEVEEQLAGELVKKRIGSVHKYETGAIAGIGEDVEECRRGRASS